MKKKYTLFIAVVILVAVVVNVFTYTSIINGSSTVLKLMKRVNFAYVAPKLYFNLTSRYQKKPRVENYSSKQLENLISYKSYDFVRSAFKKDDNRVERLLDPSAQFIRSKDGSGFIRYVENGIHVEGYMATDKKFLKAKQRWYIIEDNRTITCSMEVYMENNEKPELWYIHFRKVNDEWKIYMLENNI